MIEYFILCLDPCAEVTCQNGGECVEGECECPSPYTGEYCEGK